MIFVHSILIDNNTSAYIEGKTHDFTNLQKALEFINLRSETGNTMIYLATKCKLDNIFTSKSPIYYKTNGKIETVHGFLEWYNFEYIEDGQKSSNQMRKWCRNTKFVKIPSVINRVQYKVDKTKRYLFVAGQGKNEIEGKLIALTETPMNDQELNTYIANEVIAECLTNDILMFECMFVKQVGEEQR